MPPHVATDKTRRSRAVRREQQRRNLFDALERLLAVTPFPEITVPRLLDEAGISRATFYLYFDNTAALLLDTAEAVFAEGDAVMGGWWRHSPAFSRSELEAALAEVFDLYRRHKDVLRALVDASGYHPDVRARMTGMHARYVDGLAAHIEAGRASGDIRPDVRPGTTAAWVIWMIERGLYQLVADAPAAEVDHEVDALAGLIWNGLYRR